MNDEATWTPEPWEVHEHGDVGAGGWFSIGHGGWGPIVDIESRIYAVFPGYENPIGEMKYLVRPIEQQRAEAHRIVACVNALSGVTLSEGASVAELVRLMQLRVDAEEMSMSDLDKKWGSSLIDDYCNDGGAELFRRALAHFHLTDTERS